MARSANGTLKKREEFIAALRERGNVGEACQVAGLPRRTVYNWRGEVPEFADAWAEALDEAADTMEREAYRRAVEGVEKPVFGALGNNMGSGEVGRIREYSDTLLIFMLKAARPEKYRERYDVKADVKAAVKGYGQVSPDDWDGSAD